MPKITFAEHDGTETVIDATSGESLMQEATLNGVAGIVAECGGSCSCATCHCYLDESLFEQIEPASEMEKGLLAFATEVKATSRLSCQVEITDEMDGMTVLLPASQY